jgi:hypothetical protein
LIHFHNGTYAGYFSTEEVLDDDDTLGSMQSDCTFSESVVGTFTVSQVN